MNRLTFPKPRHLRHAKDFARVYARQLRAGDNVLLVFADESPEPLSRIGLSVSRKHGNAVKRQRIKRLLREAFRLDQHVLPRGLDLILIPRVNSGASVSDYRESLRKLVTRLEKRLPQRSSRATPAEHTGGDRQ